MSPDAPRVSGTLHEQHPGGSRHVLLLEALALQHKALRPTLADEGVMTLDFPDPHHPPVPLQERPA